MASEAQFCESCWINHADAYVTWHCSACYGKKPGGGREKWGHLCPMTLVPGAAGLDSIPATADPDRAR